MRKKAITRLSFFFLFFVIGCAHKQNNVHIFSGIKKDGITNNCGFSFFRETKIEYNGLQFYYFKLELLNGKKRIASYMGFFDNSLYLYSPNKKKSWRLVDFNTKKESCDSIKISYDVLLDSVYNFEIIRKICSDGYILDSQNDTLYKVFVEDFSLLKQNDNLCLYISKKNGIVAWTSQLNDGLILGYGGEIFSDTSMTLKNSNKVLY